MNDNKIAIKTVALIIFMAVLIVGIRMYYIGFHNLDLAQNLRYLEQRYKIELKDSATTITGKLIELTPEQMYCDGTSQQEKSIILIICGSCGLTYIWLKRVDPK